MGTNSIENEIAIYPTDTVWGIGASVSNDAAIKKINEIKKIKNLKPQSIIFPSLSTLINSLKKKKSVIFDELFLKSLFSYQVTLAYPLDAFDLKISSDVVCDSPFICVRIVEEKWIHDIYNKFGGPFTTTSLNETGFPPIINSVEAKKFMTKNCPNVSFYEGDGRGLSGISSTIVKIENSKVSYWRKGNDFVYLDKLFQQFSLNCD